MGDGPGPLLIAHAMLHNGQWTVSCLTDFYDSSFPISSIYASNIQQPFLANLTLWVEILWPVSATVLSMELRLCIGPPQFRQHGCAAEQGQLQQRWLQLKLGTWVASKGLGWRLADIFGGWNFGEASNPSETKGRIKTLAYETVPFAAQFFCRTSNDYTASIGQRLKLPRSSKIYLARIISKRQAAEPWSRVPWDFLGPRAPKAWKKEPLCRARMYLLF